MGGQEGDGHFLWVWMGVQVGDVLDRGEEERECFELLLRLKVCVRACARARDDAARAIDRSIHR